MTTKNKTYEVLFFLQDGHRIFSKKDTPGFIIADNSGSTPELTDDGELFLDLDRNLLVEVDVNGNSFCSIPLLDAEDKPTRTPTNPATILFLAGTFDWKISVQCEKQRSFEARAFIA